MPGAPPKPAGANFYPDGATKADLERWMQSLPEAERARATGFFTIIRRGRGGGFSAVPYNVEYQAELARAAALLREAAALATEPTLKTFLTKRADAFLSNDYYDSDVAWMELKGAIEPTIGPYEVYEDELLQLQGGVRGVHHRAGRSRDRRSCRSSPASCRTSRITCRSTRSTAIRSSARSRRSSSSTRSSPPATPTAACRRRPSTCRTTSASSREKGAKRVMLKNVQDAKFAKTLVPISKVVLSPADQKDLSFDAFFTQIVVHELMHGLGPHNITVGGRQTTVRQEMKEASSFLEEAKADISGLFAIQYWIDKGVLPKSLERPLYTTYLASAFRSIRFGVNEAHGRGVAVQLNYLLDQGGFRRAPDGTFAVDPAKVKAGVAGLTREIMTIQAEGDYAKAVALRDRLGVVRPVVKQALDKLVGVPVDIEPRFTTAEELVASDRPAAGPARPARPGQWPTACSIPSAG